MSFIAFWNFTKRVRPAVKAGLPVTAMTVHNTWHQKFTLYFLVPIAGIGLIKCVGAACSPWLIYSVRPVDKTGLTLFFVASMRSQPSKLIPDISSWSSASQMLIATCEILIESSAWTTSTSSPSHWIRHWCSSWYESNPCQVGCCMCSCYWWWRKRSGRSCFRWSDPHWGRLELLKSVRWSHSAWH
jgi:hypothetical protein